ncbi:phage/plasmid primase, P4 family, partial [Paracoccus sp. TK19116]
QAYLQRMAGYCLTGSTREQVFFFFHGTGANGKTVFLQTLSAVLGTYAATAALGTFTAGRSERHLTELAGLRGARLVVVSETESGQSWAEGRIKTITGGEPVRANFMHRDHFEFRPQFKLIVAGNHRPAFTSINEAIRRRLHLVPFPVTIPAEHRDPLLCSRLLAERDGILAWALAGCAEWLRKGLAPPIAITAASSDYVTDEDTVGEWIEECCGTGPDRKATAKSLYASWSTWAEASGAPKGSQKSLGEALRERHFRAAKVNGARGWLGIAPLHRQPQAEAAQ